MARLAENDPLGELRESVGLSGPLVVLPVRHHSPACAWQVRRQILDYRPTAVLIEGPSDANPLLGELVDERTKPPVAFYCFVRKTEQNPAFACWYPFCEHSPEWVAVQTGREVGADVSFIDLPSWWKASLTPNDDGAETIENSYGDHQLRFSTVTEALCDRTGVRDFDELWDALFEADGYERPADRFWGDMATFSRLARETADVAAMKTDGTSEREAYMAARVQEKLPNHERVLVLVGGFHLSAILERLRSETVEPAPPQTPKESDRGCYLTMYSDRQLDRWSGYQAGMPAPAFYRELWQSISRDRPRAGSDPILGRAAQKVRRAGAFVSTADLIAAQQMLEGLAMFRGHRRPTREDLRDAVRAAWVKGSLDDAHGRLADLVDDALVGNKVGAVSPDAGTPPIVRDFHAEIRKLRLPAKSDANVRTSGAMKGRLVHLDLYVRAAHRAKSAFLHRLAQLEVPYAKLQAGPDFTAGKDLDRVREVWQVGWHPRVDGQLIEQARRGATIAEAAANALLEQTQDASHVQGASAAVRSLTSALVMAFPSLADEFVELVDSRLRTSGDFMDAADALSGLVDLLAYRTVLGGDREPATARLAEAAYERAVWLIDTLPGLVDSPVDRQTERALISLARLRHVVLARRLPDVDEERFFKALEAVGKKLGKTPLLEGAVFGVLRQGGRIGDAETLAAVQTAASNTAVGDKQALGDFLRGLFTMTRHAVSCGMQIIEAVGRCIAPLEEERFLETLPGLRLAFTRFPPRELRRIAELIEESVKGKATTEESPDLQAGRSVDRQVAEFLARYPL